VQHRSTDLNFSAGIYQLIELAMYKSRDPTDYLVDFTELS